MALTQADVDQFLAADKSTAAGSRMRWISRNIHNRRCHVAVEAEGIRVGELILIANVALARHWTFMLLRRRAEILRWDLVMPPYRHRNPKMCGDGYPRVVRQLEHEHLWRDGCGTRCVRPVADLATSTHREAMDAFCERAKIKVQPPYDPPPPVGEQLSL